MIKNIFNPKNNIFYFDFFYDVLIINIVLFSFRYHDIHSGERILRIKQIENQCK